MYKTSNPATVSFVQPSVGCSIFSPGLAITQIGTVNTSPAGEGVAKVIDGLTSTKYLNFDTYNHRL